MTSNGPGRRPQFDPAHVDGIDEIDVKIMKILQTEGRIALSEIARRLDRGTATIHERTDTLEEEGFIKGYRAELDEQMLGYSEVAFINVKSEPGNFSGVAERLAENPRVQEVHEITGDADLLLKVRVKNRDSLTDLLAEIGQKEGVEGVETNIALRSVKNDQSVHL